MHLFSLFFPLKVNNILLVNTFKYYRRRGGGELTIMTSGKASLRFVLLVQGSQHSFGPLFTFGLYTYKFMLINDPPF